MACCFFRTAGAAAVALVLTSTAFAQAPPAAARFDISGYAVEGQPLLRGDDFSRIVSPFIGKQKTAADVQKAQQALQQAYLDLGHCSVRVTLPKAEPDAGTVTLRLVQSPVPVSKDCLPMVVLDDKRAAPVPVAPGEVAIRPLVDPTQIAAESPAPSEAPTQIARAPLKPLQDRPVAPRAPAPPEIAVPATRDTPPDVSVKSLAEAPPQPALILTPPVPADKPATIAVAPVSAPQPKPEVALAPPPKVEPKPVVVPPPVAAVKPEPPAPVIAAPQPKPVPAPVAAIPEPSPAPVVAVAPQPEPAPAPKPQPVIEAVKEQVAATPPIAPAPSKPAVIAERPVEKPAPDVVAIAPTKPEIVKPVAPPVAPVAPAATPEPVVTPRVVEAPKVAEPIKEQLAAKQGVAPAPPAVVEKPVARPAPEIVAAAPAKPEPARPEPAPVSAPPEPTPAPIAAVVEPIKPAPPAPVIAVAPQPEAPPTPKPQPVIEKVKEQVAPKPDIAPAPPIPPVIVERPVEKPAVDIVAIAPKPEPVQPVAPVAPVVAPEPIAASPRVVEPTPKPAVEPVVPAPPAPAIAVAPPPAPAPKPQPAVEPVKEQVAAKPEIAPAPAAPSVVAEKPAEKPAAEEVVVRPLTGVIATAPEPREPAEVKREAERAPVRPLQDRPSAIAQEQPVAKPPSVVVQAPAPAAPIEPLPGVDTSAATAALKFDIDRYQIEGNTLLKPDAISKALSSYTGKQKDFADVQRALEALQVAYQKAGWGAVQVTLPEQELERGEVRFEVTETRIGKIDVQGNEYFSEANVRRSVPSLQPGKTPNSLEIARSLKVANENPAKQSQVSLKAGSKDGEVDATIKVVDDNPRKYSVSMDNTGTANTGQLRLGFGFQNANLWGRDHQLTLQYITNPDHVNKVTVLGLGYHIPLYERGDSIDLILGYSDVDSGTVQQLFNVSGAGLIALARYNHQLRRIEDYEHKVTFGLDYKAFQNRVLIGNAALVPDITLHPLSVAYSGEYRKDENALNFYASLTYNPFEGGNDAAQSDFRASRGSGGGASAEYLIWRYGMTYQRLLFDDWTARVVYNGQTTRNALVAGEQFGLGGANSVRGFNERTYSNDKGHQASFELYTPDLANWIGFESGRLKLLAFYDTGSLGRNFLQVGEQTGLGVDSVGLGLRLTFRDKFNLRMDYAQVKHDGGVDAGIRDGRRNSNTFHASAVFVY